MCGRPATSIARDVFRHEVPGAVMVTHSATDIFHRGCDLHPAESVEHVTQLPPRS